MGFFEVSRPAKRRMDIAAGLPSEHPAVYERIDALIDAVPDPALLCAEERVGSMAAVQALINRLTSTLTHLAGAADEAGDSRVLHAGTTGTLVAAATGQSAAAGSGLVGTARALRDAPAVAAAYAAGRLNTADVLALTRARPHLPSFASLEESLVAVAEKTDAHELRGLLAVLIAQDTPEDADRRLEAQREKRGLRLSEQGNGLFWVDGWLDPLEGRRLRDALAHFMDRPAPGDPRTAPQRRVDALGDIVAAAMANTKPQGLGGLTVLVDAENLPDGAQALLDDSTPIGPAAFARLTCTAICTLILGSRRQDTFVPLAMGRTARRATRGQWAALIARDRGCIRCGRAPGFCESHHIVHWTDGGVTDVSNLVLLCSRCHHDLHLGHYTVTMVDGIPVIRPNRSPPIRAG